MAQPYRSTATLLVALLLGLAACDSGASRPADADAAARDAETAAPDALPRDAETAAPDARPDDAETAPPDAIPTDSGGAAAWQRHYAVGPPLAYALEIAPADWQAMLADPLCTGGPPCGSAYLPARLTFEGREFYPVGVRFKGNSSLAGVAELQPGEPGYERYSFKIKLDEYVEGQTLDGLKTLNLNNAYLDPSLMREVLAYELFRHAGVPASRAAYATLAVNGAPYGLYVSVQEVDKSFLRQWFSDDEGNLYKPEYGDLVYRGASIADYAVTVTEPTGTTAVAGEANYVKKTNEAAADYGDIIALMAVLQDGSDPERDIAAVFDVDRFLSYVAVHALIVALDGYGGGLPQNYYLYRDPANGKFTFIPWDLNNAFGTFNCFLLTADQVLNLNIDAPYCFETPDAVNAGAPIGAASRPLFGRIIEVAAFRAALHDKIAALLDGAFSEAALGARIAAIGAFIEDAAAADAHPFYAHADVLKNRTERVDIAPGLAPFIAGRAAAVRAQLAVPVVCGDGVCTAGENCARDCAVACGDCQTYHEPAGRCVPSCANGCVCPATAPDGQPLVCDPGLGICHP